jgi:hypothetical protein
VRLLMTSGFPEVAGSISSRCYMAGTEQSATMPYMTMRRSGVELLNTLAGHASEMRGSITLSVWAETLMEVRQLTRKVVKAPFDSFARRYKSSGAALFNPHSPAPPKSSP